MITAAETTLCFSIFGRPPYFLYNTDPQRLAQVHHLLLDYVKTDRYAHSKTCRSTNPYQIKCSECNFENWLKHVTKYMTGLCTIDLYMGFRPKRSDVPSYKDSWVLALLGLQTKLKAIRRFRTCVMRDGNYYSAEFDDKYTSMIETFAHVIRNRLECSKSSITTSDEQLHV